jgi:AcrR family transcriptional regulator
MSPRPETRAQRGPYSSPRQEERQRRILEVAREEISRSGYDAITMQALALAAGVSNNTLYNLYGTKDELLLAAVADLLGNLEHQEAVLAADSGIPRLLAFNESTSAQIVRTPRYAEVMARALFQAPEWHKLVDVLLGGAVRFARSALEAEQSAGGFAAEVDIDELAHILAAHQWGVVLMWSKGLLALEDIGPRSRQSQLLTLLPLCTPSRRRALERLRGA